MKQLGFLVRSADSILYIVTGIFFLAWIVAAVSIGPFVAETVALIILTALIGGAGWVTKKMLEALKEYCKGEIKYAAEKILSDRKTHDKDDLIREVSKDRVLCMLVFDLFFVSWVGEIKGVIVTQNGYQLKRS